MLEVGKVKLTQDRWWYKSTLTLRPLLQPYVMPPNEYNIRGKNGRFDLEKAGTCDAWPTD